MWTDYCWLYKSAEIGLVDFIDFFFLFVLLVFKKLLIQFWVNPIMKPLHPLRGELGMNIGSDKSLDFGIYLFCLLKRSQHLTICDKNKDFFCKIAKRYTFVLYFKYWKFCYCISWTVRPRRNCWICKRRDMIRRVCVPDLCCYAVTKHWKIFCV